MRVFDSATGKQLGEPITHNLEITHLALSHAGSERKLVRTSPRVCSNPPQASNYYGGVSSSPTRVLIRPTRINPSLSSSNAKLISPPSPLANRDGPDPYTSNRACLGYPGG